MKEAFDILERALIVHRARPSTSTRLPIIEKLRKAPKLFFLDVGLTNYRIGFKEFFSSRQSLDNVYQGKISEQVVAQEIISQTYLSPSLRFWIREKGSAETDLLCPFKFRDFLNHFNLLPWSNLPSIYTFYTDNADRIFPLF